MKSFRRCVLPLNPPPHIFMEMGSCWIKPLSDKQTRSVVLSEDNVTCKTTCAMLSRSYLNQLISASHTKK